MKKRAQLKISFGMMFSIILIIIFLAFTFYAIKMVLSWNDSIKEGKFLGDLQDDVDKMYSASQGSKQETYSLPKKIEKVCFVSESTTSTGEDKSIYSDLKSEIYKSSRNLVFYPVGSSKSQINSVEIKNIDLPQILNHSNPLCFDNDGGEVTINIKKIYGERLVVLS